MSETQQHWDEICPATRGTGPCTCFAGAPPSVPDLLPPPTGRTGKRQELRIPISPGNDAVLYVRFPMTESDWDQFMTVLAAMKPGIVRDAQGPQ